MSLPGPTRDAIVERLRTVIAPGSDKDVITLNIVRQIALDDGVARIEFELPPGAAPFQEQLRSSTAAALQHIPGLRSVSVECTIRANRATTSMPGVRHVIAVGAGKGGVGKSTIAAVLAVGLQRLGFRVGLLDADVYGPSIPKIMGMEDMTPTGDEHGRIHPPEIEGIRVMSMGFIVPPDEAIVWRGPMAQKYVKEFLDRGAWGELDFLIVDLPPGTGDIPLTLAQSIPLTGAVVVCTPQDVALLDAVKALRMYQKLAVDILGIVENMSYYLCPHCGHRDDVFSTGGAEKAARDLAVPFLGAIPLNVAIRVNGDGGAPLSNFTRTEPFVRDALESIVKALVAQVEAKSAQRSPLPQLRIS
ncbi:MAG: Iron-sulfur cluster carrier protein [Phycisphaerae bacterium]|nr:Iron-sulfur cluster carrier protein [Phycisphaerae bacterium]